MLAKRVIGLLSWAYDYDKSGSSWYVQNTKAKNVGKFGRGYLSRCLGLWPNSTRQQQGAEGAHGTPSINWGGRLGERSTEEPRVRPLPQPPQDRKPRTKTSHYTENPKGCVTFRSLFTHNFPVHWLLANTNHTAPVNPCHIRIHKKNRNAVTGGPDVDGSGHRPPNVSDRKSQRCPACNESSSASGGSLQGGASFKVEKAHFAAWKKMGPENRKDEVKLRPPLCRPLKHSMNEICTCTWKYRYFDPAQCQTQNLLTEVHMTQATQDYSH